MQSTINWKLADNYLRCHPNFHGRAHYDFVLVKTLGTPFFGELVYMFSSIVDEKSYHLALIWPYEVVKHRSHKDRDLGLLRVCQRAGVTSEIISVDTVIRGAVAVSTGENDHHRDRFIMDLLDEDLFLCIKQLYPGHTDSFVG
ncbi:hypothetical protein C8J56DRAFT_780963 [Mycena floridula]|nr:hypothetical protein C8J56DRAFT_780963 [Mycena floridula]